MGQVRTLCLEVEARFGVRVMANSAMFTWLVQHAAWLCNRYQPHHGLTPFERLRGRQYHGAVFAFGQPVLLRE
eukprot:13951548-Heterocapsa_arctica.AAC.1